MFKQLWAAVTGLFAMYAIPAVGGGEQIGDGNVNDG